VVRLSRLRRGEIIAALSALVLLALVFLVPWISFASSRGDHASADAWTSLPTLRWPIIIIGVLGLLLGYLQAARPAPALPVALDVVLVTLAAITTMLLLIRLITGDGSPQAGGWLGLVASAALTAGTFMSLREEQGWEPGPEHPVEIVELGQIPGQH
jgi:peptidoglycan/LPS O-acetylase OafA/YrhL